MFGFILHLIKIMPISDGMYYSLAPLAIAGLALGGLQSIVGGVQAISARRRKEAEPQYTIPQEVFQATQMAQEMAQTGMPEASRMQALQGAQQAALFRQRAAGQSRLGQANVATNETLLSRDLLNIASADAQKRQENQIRAQQALMFKAQYKDKAYGNQWQSWANREQQRIETQRAGGRNFMQGLTSAASTLGMIGFGTGGGKTPTTTTGTQTGRGIAGGPSISDYLATSPFNTSIGVTSTPTTPTYNTSLNSYMPGTYGALMGMPSRNPFSTGISTPVANLSGYGAAVQDLFSQPIGQ